MGGDDVGVAESPHPNPSPPRGEGLEGLELDAAGDGFELLEALAHGGELDADADVVVGVLAKALASNFEALEVEPAAPGPQHREAEHRGDAERGGGEDQAGGHLFFLFIAK